MDFQRRLALATLAILGWCVTLRAEQFSPPDSRSVGLGPPSIATEFEREPGSLSELLSAPRTDPEIRTAAAFTDELPPPPGAVPGDELPLPRSQQMARINGSQSKPISVDYVFLGRSDVDGPETNVKMSQIEATYQFRLPIGERLLFTVHPIFNVLFLSGPEGPGNDVPEQLYIVAADLKVDYRIAERFSVTAGLTPGLWTDFARVTSDDFRLPVRLFGTFHVSKGLAVTGGLIYTDNFRRNLLPAAGILWDINDRWKVEALFPRSRIIYALHETILIYGVFERGGDTYNIRAYQLDEKFEYRDNRISLGTQIDVWDRATFFVETGYAFYREFRFEYQENRSINGAFVLRVGTRF